MGTELAMQVAFQVSKQDGSDAIAVANAVELKMFKAWFPRYEASPKHKADGYFRPGGEWVSPMPLGHDAASEALMKSVQHKDDPYAWYCGHFYRFLKTRPDDNMYHGFLVKRLEVPDAVFRHLKCAD